VQGLRRGFSSVTTMDAIGEVKIVLNSYRAEYAGNGGTVVTIVSKSGGSEYHGRTISSGPIPATTTLPITPTPSHRTITALLISLTRHRW
jgi:hypothetical protein